MSERPPQNRAERRAAKKAEGAAAARARGQVDPSELKKGHVYVIPSHGGDLKHEVVSVGPKWITWKVERMTGARWQTQRVLRSGWDGPYFLEVDARP